MHQTLNYSNLHLIAPSFVLIMELSHGRAVQGFAGRAQIWWLMVT